MNYSMMGSGIIIYIKALKIFSKFRAVTVRDIVLLLWRCILMRSPTHCAKLSLRIPSRFPQMYQYFIVHTILRIHQCTIVQLKMIG